MKLLNLKTVCFKRLGDFETSFSGGLNVIVGDNAKGKSTILQAIGFALYGNDAVPVKEEDIRTWGEVRNYSVALTFEHDGIKYTATRSKSTARIERHEDEGTKLVANGKTDSVRFVSELLGLNWKEFRLFVLSSQFKTTAAIDEGATALNRKVEERSGIELIDRVQSLCREQISSLTLEQARVEVTEEQIKDALGEVDKAKLELFEGQQALKHAESVALPEPVVVPSRPEPAPESLERSRFEYLKAVDNVENKHTAVQTAKEEIAEAQKALSDTTFGSEEEAVRLESEAEDYRTKINDAQVLASTAKSKLAANDRQVDAVKNLESNIISMFSNYGDEEDIKGAITTFQQGLDDTEGKISDLEKQGAVCSSNLHTQRQLLESAVCPTCGHTNEDTDVEEVKQKISRLEEESKHVAACLIESRNHRAALQTGLKSKLKQQNELEVAQSKHTELSATLLSEEELGYLDMCLTGPEPEWVEVLNTLTSQARGIRDTLAVRDQLEHNLSVAQRKLGLADSVLALAIESLSEMTEVSEADIEAARGVWDTWVSEFNEATAHNRSVTAETQAIQSNIEAAQRMVTVLEANHQKAVDTYTRLDANAESHREMETKLGQCKRLAKYLADNREKYLRSVWGQVLSVASAYVNEASSGSITAIDFVNGGFTFTEGEMVADVSAASGAQRAFIGIAVRIGLSRVLYGDSGLLVFDEPTESMTEENASAAVSTLSTAADQVLVITHKDNDQELASNVITRY